MFFQNGHLAYLCVTMGPLRILQIFNEYMEYGGEQTTVEQIERLLSKRHIVQTLTFKSSDWKTKVWHQRLTQPLKMIYNFKSKKLLSAKLDEFRPHIVLVHNVMPVGSPSVYHCLIQRKQKFAVFIHNFRPFSVNGYCWSGGKLDSGGLKLNFTSEIVHGAWRGSKVLTAWYAGILWCTHFAKIWIAVPKWIAVSHFMKNKFVEAGISPGRIDVLHHCLNPQALSNPAFPIGPPVFLFLGRISEEKGIRVLIDAWKLYIERHGKGKLIIAGEGPLLDWVRSETHNSLSIETPGLVRGEDKVALLRSCHALIVPSIWWEPFGLVVLEAYAHSKPVVVFNSGGLTELVQNHLTGWMIESGSADALANVFDDISRSPEEVFKRGAAGYEWLRVNGGQQMWLDNFEAIINPFIADATS